MNKMQAEGLDPGILDMDPNGPPPGAEPTGPPLKDDPKYAKYFKMLKMHLPKQAVMNKMQAEGLDPGILDMDPNKPAPGSGPAPATKKGFKLPPKKKSNLKPLYWNKVDPKKGHLLWSSWADAKNEEAAEEIDTAEKKMMMQLFTQRKTSKSSSKKKEISEEKPKEFSAFDSKRNFNLGIILKTVSKTIKAEALRDALIGMDSNVISNDLLIQLKKFAPDKEEMLKIKGHLKKSEAMREPMDALTKYISTVFATIDGVENIFEVVRIQLESADVTKKCDAQLKLVQTACGQVMASEDLKRLLQVILSVGNSINADTARGNAVGFKISGVSDVDSKQSYRLSDCKLARVKSDVVGDPESADSKDPDKPDLVPLGGNTLLHFIADVAAHHQIDMTMVMDDIHMVDEASEKRMAEIDANVKGLEKGMHESGVWGHAQVLVLDMHLLGAGAERIYKHFCNNLISAAHPSVNVVRSQVGGRPASTHDLARDGGCVRRAGHG